MRYRRMCACCMQGPLQCSRVSVLSTFIHVRMWQREVGMLTLVCLYLQCSFGASLRQQILPLPCMSTTKEVGRLVARWTS